MRVILTSFRDAENWEGEKYSIARWQPSGCHYPIFPVPLAPYYQGKAMIHLEPDDFRTKYEEILAHIEPELVRFFSSQPGTARLVLLCWCNPDRQKGYSGLYCHRILMGYWIEQHFPTYISVIYADGAEKPIWERKAVWRPTE